MGGVKGDCVCVCVRSYLLTFSPKAVFLEPSGLIREATKKIRTERDLLVDLPCLKLESEGKTSLEHIMAFSLRDFWLLAQTAAPLLTTILLAFGNDTLQLAFALCIMINGANQKCSMAQTRIGLDLYQACLDKKVSLLGTHTQPNQITSSPTLLAW